MLTQFKAYAWQIAAIALGVLLAVQTVRLANAQRDHARAVGVFNAAAATAERKAREQSETYRAKEQELRNAHDKIERETQATLAAATAGADRAVAAGQRLRRELADYLTAHRERATAAAAANQCAPDGPALDLLADLFRRADQRAGELAAIADTARARGTACERAHDAARETLNEPAPHAQTR